MQHPFLRRLDIGHGRLAIRGTTFVDRALDHLERREVTTALPKGETRLESGLTARFVVGCVGGEFVPCESED